MSQIIVKSQQEWDDIPKEFDGYIYIQSPRENRLIVAERKGFRVEARENSSVVAWGNSSVEARGNSSVVAWGNSSVEAWGNSSVEAWENSSVDGKGNTQIVQQSDRAKLLISGNARIVTNPHNTSEYCDFYGVPVKDGFATLYKAVRNDLTSFHDNSFAYHIGEASACQCDPSTDLSCSYGLHVSHLHWALSFGRGYGDFKIIECAVPVDKIITPTNTDGKVRTSELLVIREVPLEECGVYGKIIAKQMTAQKEA